MKNSRSREWFRSPDYYGFARRAWLRSEGFPADVFDGKPVVGICNSWSELNNCNAHLRDVAEAVKRGVWAAGGVPLEFPTISLGEMFMRPTTMLYRNLMAMDVEESIRANPLDAVVLLCGCDKTTPAQLMGAASADIPAIVVPGGPMLTGQWRGQRLGSGTDGKKLFDLYRTGRLSEEEWCEVEGCIARTAGHCAVMGTASTMTSLAEVLGMTLPGCANIPAPDSRRMAIAELTGRHVVEMIEPKLTPSRILTRDALRKRDDHVDGHGRVDQRRGSPDRDRRAAWHPAHAGRFRPGFAPHALHRERPALRRIHDGGSVSCRRRSGGDASDPRPAAHGLSDGERQDDRREHRCGAGAQRPGDPDARSAFICRRRHRGALRQPRSQRRGVQADRRRRPS